MRAKRLTLLPNAGAARSNAKRGSGERGSGRLRHATSGSRARSTQHGGVRLSLSGVRFSLLLFASFSVLIEKRTHSTGIRAADIPKLKRLAVVFLPFLVPASEPLPSVVGVLPDRRLVITTCGGPRVGRGHMVACRGATLLSGRHRIYDGLGVSRVAGNSGEKGGHVF